MVDLKLFQPEVSDAAEVLHMKLWNGLVTTGTVFDYSLNGNDGTVTGAIPSYPGFEFSGATDSINCGSGASIDDIFVGGGTVSWWQRSDGKGGGNRGRTVDKTGWFISMTGDLTVMRLYQTFTGGDDGEWKFAIVPGTIQHITVTYDNDAGANNPLVYVNGAGITATETLTPGTDVDTSDAASSLFIGNDSLDGKVWNGLISDVRLYNTIRTPSQIRDFYNQTRWRYSV